MAEVIKFYKQELPATKFVGKWYEESDKIDDTFGHLWGKWFEEGYFDLIESAACGFFEDSDAYCGLCEMTTEGMKYWIGMFLPLDAEVPEGFTSKEFPPKSLGVFYVYGTEPEVYFEECFKKLPENGYEWAKDDNGTQWMIERYACPRYTTPDEKGNIILDQCYFLN